MQSNFAKARYLFFSFPREIEVFCNAMRISAASLEIKSRSSAAVLQFRMARIRLFTDLYEFESVFAIMAALVTGFFLPNESDLERMDSADEDDIA